MSWRNPPPLLLDDQTGVGSLFGRALTVTALCEEAALAFREATGFDRVMIYRFLTTRPGAWWRKRKHHN